MAQVTGLTAARMQQIEASSVVDGSVDQDGNLILKRHDLSTFNAGNVIGPKGPKGNDASTVIAEQASTVAPTEYPTGITSFQVGAPATGWPTSYIIVTTNKINENRIWQTVHAKTSEGFWYRSGNGATWGAFKRLALQDDVTTLQTRATNLENLVRGTEIDATTNLNSLTATGTYFQSQNNEAATARNYPIGQAGILQVVSNGGNMVWQTYVPHGDLGATVYRRVSYLGIWYPWKLHKEWTDTGWTPITLENGWVNYGGSYANAQYRVLNRVIYVVGLIKNGTITNGTRICKLPDELGQIGNSIENVQTYGGTTVGAPARIDVESDGAITIRGGVNSNWLSLAPRPWPMKP